MAASPISQNLKNESTIYLTVQDKKRYIYSMYFISVRDILEIHYSTQYQLDYQISNSLNRLEM